MAGQGGVKPRTHRACFALDTVLITAQVPVKKKKKGRRWKKKTERGETFRGRILDSTHGTRQKHACRGREKNTADHRDRERSRQYVAVRGERRRVCRVAGATRSRRS